MAIGVSLADVMGIDDPLDTQDFLFRIPAFPGGDGRHLQIKCKSASLPSFGTEKRTLELHGYKTHYSGRKEFDGSMEVTFIETRSATVYRDLMIWSELVRSTRFAVGATKAIYSTVGQIVLLDNAQMEAATFTVQGLFPEKVAEVQLGEQGFVEVNTTFSFDVLAPEILGVL